MKRLLMSIVAGGSLLATASVGHADLLAYEGFEYPAGPVDGLSGGSGWRPVPDGAWDNQMDGSDYSVASGSALTFGPLVTSGLGMSGGGNFRTVGRRVDTRGDGSWAAAGVVSDGWSEGEADQGTVWFSSLVRRDAANRLLQINFIGSNTPWFLGPPGTITLVNDTDLDEWNGVSDVWHLGTQAGSSLGSPVSTGISAGTGLTQLLLAKFDFNGTASQVRFWVYSDPSSLPVSTPADASAHATLTGLDQDAIGFRGVGFYLHNSGGSGSVDEIRFGTTYADVVPLVPEPAMLSMLALAGTLLLRRRA